jgi:hypothetical protein
MIECRVKTREFEISEGFWGSYGHVEAAVETHATLVPRPAEGRHARHILTCRV